MDDCEPLGVFQQPASADLLRAIIERLPKYFHASVRTTLRQAGEIDDADKAEKLIDNLAQRLEPEAPGVSASILEELDEIITVNRLGLSAERRHSLACTTINENMIGSILRVCRNLKRGREALAVLQRQNATETNLASHSVAA